MSCPIEIERRVLCAAENAAMASLTEEEQKENYLLGQRNMRMSFNYKCTNLFLGIIDFLYPYFNHSSLLSHYHELPQSTV